MKKIIAITAMVAAAAGIAFAADVSAASKIGGKAFVYDGATEQFDLMQQGNDSHDYAQPNITFSIDGEKAGASLKLTTDGKNLNVAQTTQTIWVKPIDALKVTVGNYDIALNKEQIDWTQSVTGLGGNGFLISLNAAGVSLDFALNEGNNLASWLTKGTNTTAATTAEYGWVDDTTGKAATAESTAVHWGVVTPAADATSDSYTTINEMSVKAGYSADFGTIGAFLTLNRNVNRYNGFDRLFTTDLKDGSIKNVSFGAGYNNNFSGVNVAGNVVGYMGDKFDWIRPELFVSGSVEALSYAAFVAPLIWTNSDLDNDFEVELLAKVSYNLGSVTPYIYFKDENLAAKKFAATIKAGVNGSIEALGWNVWLQLDTGKGTDQDKVAVSVPFELTIAF